MKRYLLLLSALLFAQLSNAQTGAVDTVTVERMNKGLVTSSLDALTGRAAGVQVSTGGNQEAMVSAVRVRGTTSLTGGNDPLVIIDGVTFKYLSCRHRKFYYFEGCVRDSPIRFSWCSRSNRGRYKERPSVSVSYILRWYRRF